MLQLELEPELELATGRKKKFGYLNIPDVLTDYLL